MGFGSGFGVNFTAATRFAAAGAAPTPTAAGLTALVTLARDDGASDGDLYKDTLTGRDYFYRTVGSGILVPSQFQEFKTASLWSNASGDCYVTLADATTGSLVSRGWAFDTDYATSDISISDGAPLVMSAPADGNWANTIFTSTDTSGSAKEYLVVGKIKCSGNTSDYDIQGRFRLDRGISDFKVFINFFQETTGGSRGPGNLAFMTDDPARGRGSSTAVMGTDPFWFCWHAPASTGRTSVDHKTVGYYNDQAEAQSVTFYDLALTSSSPVMVTDYEDAVAGDMGAGGLGRFLMTQNRYSSGPIPTFHIYELFIFTT